MSLPYRRAYLYLIALLGLTAWAFWPSYFSVLSEVSIGVHIHGITATVWMALLIWQSWAIHNAPFALHRLGGRLALLVAPLFIGGGLLVVQFMQITRTPFYDIYATRLGIYDLIATAAFAGFFLAALLTRRTPGLHARFMLGTAFLLFGPVFGRLVPDFVPGLTIRGIEDFARFATVIHLGNALAIAFLLTLFLRARRHGWPFAVVAAVIAFQSVGFEWVGRMDWFVEAMADYRALPQPALFATGVAMGIVVTAAGWLGGGRPKPAAPAPGPA